MRAFLITFMLLGVVSPSLVFGASLNAGFVEGLWYSGEPVIAGEPTRMYVALRNNTDHDLTGTVRFSDNGARIGTSNISALPGRLVEAWIDWTPQYGEHKIIATLSDVRVHILGESPESGAIEDTIAEDVLFADYDTDKDGIPNKTDTDDDGDTVSDTDEITKGADPLKADPLPKDTPTTTPPQKGVSTTGSEKKPEPKTLTTPLPNSGLEEYVPEGAARALVTTVTDKITDAKSSLDTYRDTRSDAIKDYLSQGERVLEESAGTDTLGNGTTITRTKVESNNGGFFNAAIDAGKALVRGFYSLILWLASVTLSHPAILELVLLLFIISLIYRTARRLGRRRIGN